MENDADAAALGEAGWGAGRDKSRLAYVTGLLVEHGLTPATARLRARLLYLALIGEFSWTSHGGNPTPRHTLEALGELLLGG